MSLATSITDGFRKLGKSLFRQEEDARLRALADLLTDVPLFNPLPRGMLIHLAEAFHERAYRCLLYPSPRPRDA